MGQFCFSSCPSTRMDRELSNVEIFCPEIKRRTPSLHRREEGMRQPVDVVKEVACTLYYLSDEGRMRKTASAFGILKQVVSKIVRDACYAITKHIGPKYRKVPFTEDGVRELTEHFEKGHGIPQ